jgi:cytochrome b involved in lipid metabolism
MEPSSPALLPGQLAPVPRFQELSSLFGPGVAHDCYANVHQTMANLGRAVQFGQHRRLIELLDSTLSLSTLFAITAECLLSHEVCTAFSVYFTTLEQVYHWPRNDADISTPSTLQDHKLVVQVLHQPELRKVLQETTNMSLDQHGSHTSAQIAQAALAMARWMIYEAHDAQGSLSADKQDRVNLLYRTCRGDWFDQGDYRDVTSHLEFGRLHEAIRTNGTQRRVQEIFEETGGLARLQRMPDLLRALPTSTHQVCEAMVDLQLTAVRANEELFSMMIDETIWGCTFARFSKAVGVCTISAGGADCPMFRMLDAFCGRADPKSQAMLMDELDFRTRFFPPNMRALIEAVAAAPSIRNYVSTSPTASYAMIQAFNALQRALWGLYEMHRKKALRIVLALRAGQLHTSSGTQKTTSPEMHIGGILSQAMQVRFGRGPDTLSTDAYGWPAPLLYGLDGLVEVAHVRLVLSTPLVVSAGDTIRLSVQVEPGAWETRTYSVMRSEPHWRQANGNKADQICAATSVEVCIRRQGAVSSYLCTQGTGFPVRVAVQHSPHFRIHANTDADDETIFVAQGAAAGLFIAWLAHYQDSIIGRYRLVVGARSWSQLAHSSQLLQLLAESRREDVNDHISVVVCLSARATGELAIPLAAGIQVYAGRVTEYLRLGVMDRHIQAVYVCGSAAFGMDAARCIMIDEAQSNREYSDNSALGPRLKPIRTSHLPTLRLHVAPEPTLAKTRHGNDVRPQRTISRSELAQHNTPEDLWIAVDDRVYDITPVMSFHPGGEKLLIYRAGRQAGDVFTLVHGNSHEIMAMLGEMEVGTLAPAIPDETLAVWEQRLDRIVEIQNDLTNYSRFEQSPTGSSAQLPFAPPVDVIRRSLRGFFADWTGFLSDLSPHVQTEFSLLHKAMDGVQACFDEYQARVYNEVFDDIQRCATALRDIFEAHAAAVSEIHAVIDHLKRDLLSCLERGCIPNSEFLRDTAVQFPVVLQNAIRPFQEQARLPIPE